MGSRLRPGSPPPPRASAFRRAHRPPHSSRPGAAPSPSPAAPAPDGLPPAGAPRPYNPFALTCDDPFALTCDDPFALSGAPASPRTPPAPPPPAPAPSAAQGPPRHAVLALVMRKYRVAAPAPPAPTPPVAGPPPPPPRPAHGPRTGPGFRVEARVWPVPHAGAGDLLAAVDWDGARGAFVDFVGPAHVHCLWHIVQPLALLLLPVDDAALQWGRSGTAGEVAFPVPSTARALARFPPHGAPPVTVLDPLPRRPQA